MGFTSFKSLPRMLQVLICFFAFGTVLSFFPQLLPKFQGQDGTQPLFNVFWPIIGGGPLSGLIHILILWTLGLDLYYRLGLKKWNYFYLLYIILVPILALTYREFVGEPGLIGGSILLNLHLFILSGFLFSDRKIHIFFLFQIQMKYATIIFVFILLMTYNQLAWPFLIITLIPSLIWGIVEMKISARYILELLKGKRSGLREPKGQVYQFPINEYGEKVVEKLNVNQDTFYELDRELDELLKKVSKVGRKNLGERDQSRLIEISQKMKERKGKR